MATKNYRKITVGDSFSDCIAYVKGASYLGRSIKITDIIPSETEGGLDIYVQANEKGSAKVLWKTISEKQILEAEYDLNFE
jgi:hypothetical protein